MTIQLIDVSSAQGDIPEHVWRELSATDVRGVIVKVTEGKYVDPRARANLERARDAGLIAGVYAYARMSLGEPEPQVEALWRAMGDEMPALPPAFDLENRPLGSTNTAVVEWAERWVRAATETFGRPPLLYSYPYFLQQLGDLLRDSETLTGCPLWIAGGRQYLHGDGHIPDLTVEGPPLIAPWATAWALWQFDGNGGRLLPNGVDVDWNVCRNEQVWAFLRGIDTTPTAPELPASSDAILADDGGRAGRDATTDAIHELAAEEVKTRHED